MPAIGSNSQPASASVPNQVAIAASHEVKLYSKEMRMGLVEEFKVMYIAQNDSQPI